MSLKKINLSLQDKNLINGVYKFNIHFRNDFGKDKNTISELMKIGFENAQSYLKRNRLGHKLSLLDENNLFKSIVLLQSQLQLVNLPRRIECYDISHLQGKFVYGSMVTFIDGRAEKKFYRLFKCPDGNNDFENHKQVLTRRIERHLQNPDDKGWNLPDLIIVDGGKGQLSGNTNILESFELEKQIEIISLAKREEEVFFPALIHSELVKATNLKLGSENGFLLNGDTKFLLQRIRDEAHRFAITNNRNARIKMARKSDLDNINGIGEVTKNKLLTNFGSLKGVIEAYYYNKELLYKVAGESVVKAIETYYNLHSE